MLFHDWEEAIDICVYTCISGLDRVTKESCWFIQIVCALKKEEIEIEKLTKRPL